MAQSESTMATPGGAAGPAAGAVPGTQRKVLVTGFPVQIARQVARELVLAGDHVLLLHREKFTREAALFAEQLAVGPGRLELLWGDILDLDLGLAGPEVRRVHAEVEEIHHVAAVQYLAIDGARMRAVNVEGLREVLELALGMRRLRRICHWSTAFVAGGRSGVATEDELNVGQTLRNDYERSKLEAEELARQAMSRLPITIVRPPILVGDSQNGEVQRLDGPSLLINAIVHAPVHTAVPLPGQGRYPLHLLPVDFAVRAAVALTRHPEAAGGTYHLVDPDPMSAYEFFCAVADAAGRPRPTVFLPGALSRAVLGLPGVRSLVPNERSFVEWFDTDIRFDDRHARRLLTPLGLTPPPVRSYVDVLVRYVRESNS